MNIIIIGEGMHKTTIFENKSFGGGIGTYYTAIVDTLYRNHENKFHKEFIILRIIDFIFGDANVMLQNCLVEVRKPLKPIHHYDNTIEKYQEWINRTRVSTLRLVTLDAGDNVTM
uniref:Pectinesterase n=1 Tax=Solanum tuberosum TaxID=4113 RepID=M1DKR8_SOLTU